MASRVDCPPATKHYDWMSVIHSSGTTGEDGGELVPTMSFGLGELAGEAIDVLGGPVVNIFRVGDRNFDGGLDRPWVDELL